MTMPPGFGGGGRNEGGGSGGPAAEVPMGVCGAANQAVLQSILLAQQHRLSTVTQPPTSTSRQWVFGVQGMAAATLNL